MELFPDTGSGQGSRETGYKSLWCRPNVQLNSFAGTGLPLELWWFMPYSLPEEGLWRDNQTHPFQKPNALYRLTMIVYVSVSELIWFNLQWKKNILHPEVCVCVTWCHIGPIWLWVILINRLFDFPHFSNIHDISHVYPPQFIHLFQNVSWTMQCTLHVLCNKQ